MMSMKIGTRLAREVARRFGGRARDCAGLTVAEALTMLERDQVTVLWGLWSQADLAEVIGV